MLIAEGMLLVKFWLHVSDAEQLERFEARAADPLKAWKLTPDDWRNRERRADYEAAVEDMLERTERGGAVAARRGGLQALRPRQGHRDRRRRGRGGDAPGRVDPP